MASVSASMPLPLESGVMKAQSGLTGGAKNLTNMQDHSGLAELIPARLATQFSLVIHTSQLNLTFLVWMITKKLVTASPNWASICSFMYWVLAETSSLQRSLASLAKLLNAVRWLAVTPGPEQLPNFSMLLEVESWILSGLSTFTASAQATKAIRQIKVLILNKICRIIIYPSTAILLKEFMAADMEMESSRIFKYRVGLIIG